MRKFGISAAALAAAAALSFSATVGTDSSAGQAGAVRDGSVLNAAAAPAVTPAAASTALAEASAGGAFSATSGTAKKKKRAKGQKAFAFAKRQLGDRYRYGASGPNAWDCSGLTQGAWRAAGVKLPHSSRAQFRRGKKVARKNLRKGDLVFFYSGISHVAIYAGNGKVIHASRAGKPVSYSKISYMPYKGARRPG